MPVKAGTSPPLEEINPALPEETIMASPEVVVQQDTSTSPINRLKSHQTPKEKVQNVTH